MRYQGRIIEWKEDRGFGFIAPNGGGAKVFVHINSFRAGEPRPAGNELVTYALESGGDKGPRAADVAYVERVRVPANAAEHRPDRARHDRERRGFQRSSWISLVLIIAIGGYGWLQFSNRYAGSRIDAGSTATRAQDAPPAASLRSVLPAATAETSFKCEGKLYCSQMASCAEATFYLRNCPGVQIDGDHDGVPCEQQLCR